MLTLTDVEMPSAFQLSICEMADSMTQSPIIMENGCCSILGRNSPGGTQTLGYQFEQAVAEGVAVLLIDLLEVINVEAGHDDVFVFTH